MVSISNVAESNIHPAQMNYMREPEQNLLLTVKDNNANLVNVPIYAAVFEKDVMKNFQVKKAGNKYTPGTKARDTSNPEKTVMYRSYRCSRTPKAECRSCLKLRFGTGRIELYYNGQCHSSGCDLEGAEGDNVFLRMMTEKGIFSTINTYEYGRCIAVSDASLLEMMHSSLFYSRPSSVRAVVLLGLTQS